MKNRILILIILAFTLSSCKSNSQNKLNKTEQENMGILDTIFNRNKNSKKTEVITEIKESWSVIQSENNGNLMLIRKNIGCDNIAGNKNYQIGCGIAFKLLSPNENGLPDIEKEPKLNSLEDDIFEILEKDLISIVPIIITTSGFREYVIYTKNLDEFKKGVEKLKKMYPKYELTSYNKLDENWKTYKSF